MKNIHDKEKIAEIKARYPEICNIEGLEPAFSSDMKEYAEHIRAKTIEEIKAKNAPEIKQANDYISKTEENIKKAIDAWNAESEAEEQSFVTEFELNKVTRIEVINHTPKGEQGRAYTYWKEYGNGVKNPKVSISLQDEGRTLKVFIKE